MQFISSSANGRAATIREIPMPLAHVQSTSCIPDGRQSELVALREQFTNIGIKMERYAFSARVLHWLLAAGFLFMWVCGYAMTSLVSEDSPAEEFLFQLHISMGITLLMLLALRILVRVTNAPPPIPASLTRWEKTGSHLGHLGLYLLPLATILVGWAEIDFGGHEMKWFSVPMPQIFPTQEVLWGFSLEDAMEVLHRWLAYTMLILTIAHVAAVVKHRWVDGHDVLYRMTFGKRDGH